MTNTESILFKELICEIFILNVTSIRIFLIESFSYIGNRCKKNVIVFTWFLFFR